jgi:Aerobic-type carbon monoxide dehydrogenase, middle subunit CoxM/CutM homologs
MTHPFLYRSAVSIGDAARELAQIGAVPLGGGTDLLVTIAEEISAPDLVIDLRTIPGGSGIEPTSDGGIRIGAVTRIADVARDAMVVASYPVLAEACNAVGTPALRHMGTLGGNLCQRPRCWYFRRGVPCFKTGGSSCPATEGENQYLAILGGGPCYIVHPSDPAVALTALDAVVEVVSTAGRRLVPMSEFYALPSERLDRETTLAAGEFVSAVIVPGNSAGGAQRYHKLMQRESWDFALVSAAGCKRRDGEIRMVLGGVAPRPWRVSSSVEEDVASGGLDEDTIGTLADRALYDAEPLSGNAYKVDLAATLLRKLMRELA